LPLKLFAGSTDCDWYELMRRLPGLDEVNFWAPAAEAVVWMRPWNTCA
jgi:hypothetical protein